MNLNVLSNKQLINHVEQSLIQYQTQKEMTNSHTMQVYGGIQGRDLQLMEKALDRCMYQNPEAMETKQRVSEVLARDFSIGIVKLAGKIKSLYEIEQEKNRMSMSKFHDMKPVR